MYTSVAAKSEKLSPYTSKERQDFVCPEENLTKKNSMEKEH